MKQSKDKLILNDIECAFGGELQELNEIKSFQNISEQNFGFIFENDCVSSLIISTLHGALSKPLLELPKSIGGLEHLKDLRLIDCRELTSIPRSIGNLKNLNMLDCTGCRSLNTLPVELGFLKNLEHLNLTDCFSIKDLPSTLVNLKNLKSLTLRNCQTLTSLPPHLGDLTSLQVLDLENCRSLKKLPESIIDLPNLRILCLKSCNLLEGLPKDIGNLQTLNGLNFNGCSRITSIPESISKLFLITCLDLSYCYSLVELPDSIGTMINLNTITLKGCRELVSLPSSIGNLKNLRRLDLYACKNLEKLPDSIKKLINLVNLDISYCVMLSDFNSNSNLTIIKSQIGSMENPVVDNIYNIKPNPHFPDHELSPYSIKDYQEKIQSDYVNPWDTSDKIDHYLNQGVVLQDARIIAQFSILLKRDLIQTEIYTNLDENQDDMHWMFHYKINRDRRVIELHIHHTDTTYLTLFPKLLCSLDQLEVIRFPNNYIEKIPECVANLKALRAFDVSNFYRPSPIISESVRPFLESLEKYNEFYNF